MGNTQGGGSKYTKYTVFLACEQIHSKYTAKYTVVVVVGRPGSHMHKWSSPNPKYQKAQLPVFK